MNSIELCTRYHQTKYKPKEEPQRFTLPNGFVMEWTGKMMSFSLNGVQMLSISNDVGLTEKITNMEEIPDGIMQ
jgi:hypothetical protein